MLRFNRKYHNKRVAAQKNRNRREYYEACVTLHDKECHSLEVIRVGAKTYVRRAPILMVLKVRTVMD